MKPTLRLLLAGMLILGGVTGLSAAAAAAASKPFRSCSTTYYKPQYLTIRHIYQQGTTCSVGHGVAHSYMNAITQTMGAGSGRTGQCFGRLTYGSCTVRFRKLGYTCFHFGPLPKRTRGLVRCRRSGRRVSFNIGT